MALSQYPCSFYFSLSWDQYFFPRNKIILELIFTMGKQKLYSFYDFDERDEYIALKNGTAICLWCSFWIWYKIVKLELVGWSCSWAFCYWLLILCICNQLCRMDLFSYQPASKDTWQIIIDFSVEATLVVRSGAHVFHFLFERKIFKVLSMQLYVSCDFTFFFFFRS